MLLIDLQILIASKTERFTLTTNIDMNKKLKQPTKPKHDAKLPVVGSYIEFPLSSKIIKSQVIRIIEDPIGRHEVKALVNVDGDLYGIPIDEIVSHTPIGQFKLF